MFVAQRVVNVAIGALANRRIAYSGGKNLSVTAEQTLSAV